MTDQTNADAVDLSAADDDALKAMGLPASFTLDSLKDHLEPEEIAKLAAGDDPIAPLPEASADAADDDDDHDDGDDDGDDDDETGDGKAGEGDDGDADDGEGDDGDAAQEGAEEAPAVDDTPDPVFAPTDVSAEKAIVDSAADKRKELREAYSAGDMSDEEYDEKRDALDEQIAEARATIKAAEKEDAIAFKQVEKVWYDKTGAFMEANPYFADKTAKPELGGDSPLMLFDQALKIVTSQKQFEKLSMAQKIEVGARMVRDHVKQLTGQDVAEPAKPAAKDPADKGKAKDAGAVADKDAGKAKPAAAEDDPLARAKANASKQGKRREALQTLGTATAATEIDASEGRFSALDRADGLEAEAAFEAMSKAEQEAYLRGA